MTITEQLTEDMKSSLKAGEAGKTGVLRLLRGALKNEEIKLGHPLAEAEAQKVLQREAKQRRDSIQAYQQAGRTDLVQQEEEELVVIQAYLPEALPEAELVAVVEEVIAGMDAPGASQMGTVIGAVMQRVGARADGGRVAQLVRERLTA